MEDLNIRNKNLEAGANSDELNSSAELVAKARESIESTPRNQDKLEGQRLPKKEGVVSLPSSVESSNVKAGDQSGLVKQVEAAGTDHAARLEVYLQDLVQPGKESSAAEALGLSND